MRFNKFSLCGNLLHARITFFCSQFNNKKLQGIYYNVPGQSKHNKIFTLLTQISPVLYL